MVVTEAPRFDVLDSSRHDRSLLRSSPREPSEGLGLASFPGCGARVERGANGPGWKSGSEAVGNVPAPVSSSAHDSRLRAHVQAGGRERRLRDAGLPASNVTVEE
jgi:hypothetical protein